MKRKLCRTSRGRNASTRDRRRSSGQIYRAVTIPHAMKLNAMLTKNQIICCGMTNLSFLEFQRLTTAGALRTAPLSRRDSLKRPWVQCPQRHQRSDRNVLVIHQMFFCERQCFHNRARLVLGLSIDHENDAFAIAARIPLADFPVEVKLYRRLNLFRYHRHDLLGCYALPGSLDDDDFCSFRYSD